MKFQNEIKKILQEHEKKFQEVQKQDKLAKEEGNLVGRYIREPFADGFAFYEIIKEFKSKVKIRVITGVGDDWTIPYWGKETTIDKEYAAENIGRRDTLTKLFTKGG